MNAIQERWHRSVRAELLNRTLVWNLAYLRLVLAEYESFYNGHRPHRALGQASPLKPLPDNIVDLDHFRITRHDRSDGILRTTWQLDLHGWTSRHPQATAPDHRPTPATTTKPQSSAL